MSTRDRSRYRASWPRVLLWVVLLVVAVYATNELFFETNGAAPTNIEPE